MEYKEIMFSTEGEIAFLTLNRPEKINALSKLKFPFKKGAIVLQYHVVCVFPGVTLLTTLLLFGVGRVLFAALDLVLCTL